MQARRLLLFLFCFVVLVGVGFGASAAQAQSCETFAGYGGGLHDHGGGRQLGVADESSLHVRVL